MPFTDFDIDFEKKWMSNHIGKIIKMPEWKVRLLLERLEAAEECCRKLENFHNDMQCLQIWRKIAGK